MRSVGWLPSVFIAAMTNACAKGRTSIGTFPAPIDDVLAAIDDLGRRGIGPDRIVLGELRGAESVSFLRAINTGHPGSFSTIHANSLRGALDQLALMVMQTGIGLTRSDTIAYAASVIDIIVQLGRDASGRRGITAIAQSAALV